MPASKVRKARGNVHLYLCIPTIGVQELTAAQLTAAYTVGDRFAEAKAAPLSASGSEIDVTNFDSGDWTDMLADSKSGSYAVSANLILDNPLYLPLVEAFSRSKTVGFLIIRGDLPGAAAKNVGQVGFATLINSNENDSGAFELTFQLNIKGEPRFFQALAAFPKHDSTPGV